MAFLAIVHIPSIIHVQYSGYNSKTKYASHLNGNAFESSNFSGSNELYSDPLSIFVQKLLPIYWTHVR